ncbi:MAG TPA: hypothetical protein D7I13_05960 [Candidatus Poseidoniales archaeon]|nr:MAG TPA: hypothetical protein D7I13_05960 [Candidatus Poseidoniales archaeon]
MAFSRCRIAMTMDPAITAVMAVSRSGVHAWLDVMCCAGEGSRPCAIQIKSSEVSSSAPPPKTATVYDQPVGYSLRSTPAASRWSAGIIERKDVELFPFNENPTSGRISRTRLSSWRWCRSKALSSVSTTYRMVWSLRFSIGVSSNSKATMRAPSSADTTLTSPEISR